MPMLVAVADRSLGGDCAWTSAVLRAALLNTQLSLQSDVVQSGYQGLAACTAYSRYVLTPIFC